MDIQPISNNKFVVGLTKADLSDLEITYDEMDYSNIETRRVIWSILDAVRESTGRDVDPSGNLMIEAAPDCHGGCLLLFTVPNSSKNVTTGTVISKTSPLQIFEFNNADDLLDAIKIIGYESIGGKVFTSGGKYRAEIMAEKATAFSHILEEYGRFISKDPLSCASTHEHWLEIKKSTS